MADAVVAKEFELRKGHLCTLPFNGLLISAQGQITLCCVSLFAPIKHLNDVSDLTDLYNGFEMEHVRSEMEQNRIGLLKSCSSCWRAYSEGQWSMMHVANVTWRDTLARHFDADWELRKRGKPRPIRYLEYTCSNICNQTCSTCSSYFSSKWRDLEQQFSHEEKKRFDRHVGETQSLSDENIQKIFEILPGLSHLVVKGGEPWADKNNVKILSRALDCNPDCRVDIISNMQSISTSTFEMLKKVKEKRATQFYVGASIDGVGKVYDWIRGGSFEKTVRNMELYYKTTGQKITLIPTASIHNYFHLETIIDYFSDKEYVSGIFLQNVASLPAYIGIHNLPNVIVTRRQGELRRILTHYEDKMKRAGKLFYYDPVFDNIKPSERFSPRGLKLSVQWIEKMNQIRGFRLQDHINELKEITEMVL